MAQKRGKEHENSEEVQAKREKARRREPIRQIPTGCCPFIVWDELLSTKRSLDPCGSGFQSRIQPRIGQTQGESLRDSGVKIARGVSP
jgi:hypothetical protein